MTLQSSVLTGHGQTAASTQNPSNFKEAPGKWTAAFPLSQVQDWGPVQVKQFKNHCSLNHRLRGMGKGE